MTEKTRAFRRDEKKYMDVLLKLSNSFLESRKQGMDKKMLELKLSTLDKTWKMYVSNWNKNPRHCFKLRSDDFLQFINSALLKIEKNETNQTNK